MSCKIGRPTDYSEEICIEICDAIACSTKGIKRLCAENEHWPSLDTIFRWKKKYKYFSDLYARAKQQQIEPLVDEILEIADDGENDYTVNAKGQTVADHDHIQRSKLRIDTRKWLASKLAPKIYGDRIQVENTNPNEDPQIINARKVVHQLMRDKKDKDDGRSDATEN